MRYCSKCGKQSKDEAIFCSGCGSELQSDGCMNNQTGRNITTDSSLKEKPTMGGALAGIILIMWGIGNLIFGILGLCGLENMTLDNGQNGTILTFVFGTVSFIFGAILLTKKINKYGWAIPSAIFISCMISSVYPFDKSTFMGAVLFAAICAYPLLKANIPKKTEK